VIASRPRRAAVVASLCAAAFIAGCGRAPSAAQDPESAANTFFAALEHGDPRVAYGSAAFGFQAGQTFDGFLSNARDLGLVDGQPPVWTGSEAHGAEVRLDGTLLSASGQPVKISVTMTPDGKAWKLFSLQTASGGQQTENHFTLVGKGSGFNDVYHQPMPGPRQIDALVHQTMAGFNSAIRKGDFHAFYLTLSQQWRDGERLTGDQAAGVTEKMLKNHFQGFTDKKIDLSAVAGMSPVYERPPQINEDGLLEVQGHFDTLDFRVSFALDYAYEIPRWKLFGIDVYLTQ
jgi:hypothetical protein